MKKILNKLTFVLFIICIIALSASAQDPTVDIPDTNFKNALLANTKINTNKDKEIQVSEAKAYTGEIRVRRKRITNMKGIEAFIKITKLNCSRNQITSIDLSKNTALQSLDINGNRTLASLDVSNNTLLTFLNLRTCKKVTSIDVTDNILLSKLDCGLTAITSLDLRKNPVLTQLSVIKTGLDSLDLTDNPKITFLRLYANQLKSIDLTKNVLLEKLYIWDNRLPSLDVSKNTKLTTLQCKNNKITKIDVTNNTKLVFLNCSNNKLPPNLDISKNINLTKFYSENNGHTAFDFSKNTKLIEVHVSGNKLTAIDLSNHPALTHINCEKNATLKSLKVSKSTKLKELYCFSTSLVSLDLSKNPNLKFLKFHDNPQLVTVDLKNGKSTGVFTHFFDARKLPKLTCLQVDDPVKFKAKYKTKLDANKLDAIKSDCIIKVNKITITGADKISIGGTIELQAIIEPDNATTKEVTWTVDNDKIASFTARDPLKATLKANTIGIVTVTATAKDGTGKFGTKSITISNQDPVVNIPDPKFKAFLTSKKFINSNEDEEIQVTEAKKYNKSILINGKGVADMTGIEAFVNLTGLYCQKNLFTVLDLSKNTKLKILDCASNPNLTRIDISKSTDLRQLKCGDNPKLANIDVTNAPQLRLLKTLNNKKITSIDVSKNPLLTDLNCINNNISKLNISNNTALQFLWLRENNIDIIDISKNAKLVTVDIRSNSIKTINTTTNKLLGTLYLSENPLAGKLDLSKNTRLRNLLGTKTQLVAINLKNGKNVFLSKFDLTDNPKLTCLQVDNKKDFIARLNAKKKVDQKIISETCYTGNTTIKVNKITITGADKISIGGTIELQATIEPDNATTKEVTWTVDNDKIASFTARDPLKATLKANTIGIVTVTATAKDGTGKFGTKPITISNQDPVVNIPDPKFKAFLTSKKFINTNNDKEIQVTEAKKYNKSILINEIGVKDMTGIEAFVNLTGLYCQKNLFTVLDLSKNTKLKILDCAFNPNLTRIDISKSTDLRQLKCGDNPKLASIDVTNAPQLRLLKTLNNKKITSIDVSKNPLLTDLNCINNNISKLNISNNIALQFLWLRENNIDIIDISKNTKLNIVDIRTNSIKTINTTTNKLLGTLYLSENPLAGKLDLSKNTRLRNLFGTKTQLVAINLKNEKNVFLSKFDLTDNPKLTCLQVDNKKDFIARLNANKKVDKKIISETCYTGNTTIKVNKITITGVNKINQKDGDIVLLATILPDNATNKELTWKVDKTNLATLTVAKNEQVLLTAKADGVVTVTATAKDGSGTNVEHKVTITNQSNTNVTSIDNVNSQSDLVLYPNPAQDRLTIATDLAIRQIEITDLAGKTIKKLSENKSIDIADLRPNIYFLLIHTDNEVIVRKFVK